MIRKIKRVFALSDQGARDLIKGVLITVLCNLSLMLPISLIMAVIQFLLKVLPAGGDPAERLLLYSGIGVLIIILLYVFHYVQYSMLYLAVYKESASRRLGLGEVLRRLPLSFFGTRDLSDLTATMIEDCSFLDSMFSHFIPQLLAASISTTIIAVFMLCFDWRMAVAVLWVVPVAVLITAGSKRLQSKYGTGSLLAKRVVTDCIQEGLETVRDIRSCSRQEGYLAEFDQKLALAEQATIRSELVTGASVSTAQAFLRVGFATTVLVGARLLFKGELPLLYYVGFLFAAARMYAPISLVLENIAATFTAKLRIDRMRTIQEEKLQTGIDELKPQGYDITFDHVSFSYHEGEGVLNNVTFTAKQGEVTALVGPSGGGKSTAAKLSARFWDVNEGTIRLGGVDISTVDPETLLRYYSIVFQDVVLFRDTIMENIRLGRREAADEEVREAARAARCEEFILNLPDGYETVIGENGSTLSGGERQRISIARALLKNAPVILLDEATASLDVENESAVQEALSRLVKNKTVLIIAHRMRTVAGADKIVVLENGRVAECDSPEKLLAKDGLYRHMVELQKGSAAWRIS